MRFRQYIDVLKGKRNLLTQNVIDHFMVILEQPSNLYNLWSMSFVVAFLIVILTLMEHNTILFILRRKYIRRTFYHIRLSLTKIILVLLDAQHLEANII